MDSSRSDFLGRYRAISAKLKKRFLRKPNVSEASSNFADLAKEMENKECPHYAAFCLLAVARCENTLGNTNEEAQTLVRAARLFLEAEELNFEMMCPSFSENLNGALQCYEDAIKIYKDQNEGALAASLYMEAGNAVLHLGRTHEALTYFQKASKIPVKTPANYIHSLEKIASCQIETCDYDCALDTLTEICKIADERSISKDGDRMGVYASILGQAEVTRVLLLLLLKPPPQKLKPENAKLMEKYTWDSVEDEKRPPVNYINEDLFILLQCLVLSIQSDDIASLRKLDDLWPFLTTEQCDLLHKIFEKYT